MSKIKPILFNTEMVRAILNGTKTVTRRVVKPHSSKACGFYVTHRISDGAFTGVYDYDEDERMFDSPQVQPAYVGDILYVRETWAVQESLWNGMDSVIYRSTCCDAYALSIKWHPSIHMPREVARIFLRVTDVRVERLQDITPEQIDAEGCKEFGYSVETGELMPSSPCYFSIVWNNTVKKADRALYGWEANPWVWVIEFERISREEALANG